MITTDGLNTMAALVGGSGAAPSHIAIGTGSATVSIGDTTLNTETDRNIITTTDLSVSKNVTFIANFTSVEVSGTNVQEFGVFNNAVADTGNLFNHEVIGSIAFEGDRELQIQTVYRYS